MSDRRRAVGVLGSLFNPPHIGHLVLAAEAAWQLGLDRVVLVPTGNPPHRPAPSEGAELRTRLAVAAVAGEALLTVSRVEVDRPGPSYTVDTLRALAADDPGCELVLIIGADQLAALDRWDRAPELPMLARLAVASRPGVPPVDQTAFAVERVEMPQVAISSSEIRARVAAGRPIRHLVPEGVRSIIESEGLYRNG